MLGIDCDPWATKTFEKYHSRVICEKIEKISVNRITREIHGREVTVLAGGPPCQAFSTIACAKNRSIGHSSTMRHPLNVLYKEFLRLVNGIEPKFFVMENVPRMFSVEGGVVKREIERALEGKYHVTFYEEDVACFGVPQFRKRVLAIGNMLGLKNPTLRHTHFPPHTAKRNGKRPFVTVRDAISDLPKLQIAQGKKFVPYVSKKNLTNYQRKMREKSEGFDEHISRSHSWRDLKIFNLLKPGQWIKDLPRECNPYREDIFQDRFKKLPWNAPSSTIIAHLSKDGLMHIHPDKRQNRSITPREAARLQSFPDNYAFEGSRTSQYIQIGNAVPPLFAKMIAKSIKNAMEVKIATGSHVTPTR